MYGLVAGQGLGSILLSFPRYIRGFLEHLRECLSFLGSDLNLNQPAASPLIRCVNSAIKTVYSQLANKPIEHFQACQWNALIDHTVIGTNQQIRFIFRTGKEIKVNL